MTIIAQYTPDNKDTYRFVRTLAYRAKFSAQLLIDIGQTIFFAVIGGVLVAVIMGASPRLFLDWEFARVMGLSLLIFYTGIFLFQLFSLWSMAPSMDGPESTEIKISKMENGLHFSGDNFEGSVPFEKIILYFVAEHFIAIKQRYGIATIIETRVMADNDVKWLKEKLAETSTKTTFWNAYKMLAG